MKSSKDCKWAWVAAIAAVVAAVTTVVLLILRAHAKKAARQECESCFDYAMDELEQLAEDAPLEDVDPTED